MQTTVETAERYPATAGGGSLRRVGLAPMLAAIALLAAGAAAQEPAPMTVYSSPEPLDLAQPIYPRAALNNDGEGWVQLNFMIDTAGKPYEIVVSDAVGHPDLKAAATRALRRSTFTPAKLGDTPLDAGYTQKYRFELAGGTPSVSRQVHVQYHRLLRLVRQGKKEKADELMARIAKTNRRNLYEDAWLNLAMFAYYAKWGTSAQQLRALNRAVAYEPRSKYLPPDLFLLAQQDRFRLLVQERDYATAMRVLYILRTLDIDDPVREHLETVAQQLATLRTDDSAYSVPGKVQADAHWHYNLFKDGFAFREVQGEIAEIKLRCARKFVFFRFDPTLEYRINDAGPCQMTVVGNPDTTFQLVQW